MVRTAIANRLRAVGRVVGHAKERGLKTVDSFFAWWGGIAFDWPWTCILASLALTAVLCLGFLPGVPKWIDGADDLYALPYSTARSQGAVRQALFNDTNSRPTFVLVTGKTPGENILTWEHLAAVEELDKLIRGKTVDPVRGRRIAIPWRPEYGGRATDDDKTEDDSKEDKGANTVLPDGSTLGLGSLIDGGGNSNYSEIINALNNASAYREKSRGDAAPDELTFQDICVMGPFGDCAVTSVVEMQLPAYREYGMIPQDSGPVVWVFDGLAFNMDKKAFPPHYLLGRAKEEPCSPELPRSMLELMFTEDRLMPGSTPSMARANMSCISEAQGFQMIYETADGAQYTQRNLDWEKALIEVLNENMEFGPLSVTFSAFRSRDDALRSSTSESSDILFVVLMFGLLLVYSSLSNFSCNLYRCKVVPAISGIFAALLGMISGMGLMSLCGIAFVPTALVCPFLVVGVGIDDMFVIINSYCLAYMIDDTRQRCKLCLKDTGLSITLTTVTSLISFSIGLNTGYLSIKNFCWFCGTGMLLGYIYVLTFFFPIVCLDAQREHNKQLSYYKLKAHQSKQKGGGADNAALSTFTLGGLMCRRAEHEALYRVALRKLHASPAMSPQTIGTSQDAVVTEGAAKVLRSECVGDCEPGIMGHISYYKRLFFYNLNARLDSLLARVALNAHRAALEMPIEPTPSHSAIVLPDLPKARMTGDPMKDILHHPRVPLYYTSLNTGRKCLYLEEPSGNVGRRWRQGLIRGFGPVLTHPYFKIGTFVCFGIFIIIGLVGCSQLQTGLDLRDLAPVNGYLHKYDEMAKAYFGEYDFPVEVFFPDDLNWWELKTQESLRELQSVFEVSGSGKLVTNPFIKMLDDPELAPLLKSGEKELFESTLQYALSLENGKYKQFEQSFLWEGSKLRAWKMQILPNAMDSSSERAKWMRQVRADCIGHENKPNGFKVMAWNYMMTFYESDLCINSSVLTNMIVAALTMLLVALVGLPNGLAGLCVVLIMGMIDVGLIGFMYFWGVKLNMVSMICLLISVGFCVDFSAHVCHTYFDAEGITKDQRAIECVVLMGGPVLHGAATSILGVLMLSFSSSYIFRVFFKMLTLVMTFALAHSVLFLPVFLTFVDKDYPHWLAHGHSHKALPAATKHLPAANSAVSTTLPSPAAPEEYQLPPRNHVLHRNDYKQTAARTEYKQARNEPTRILRRARVLTRAVPEERQDSDFSPWDDTDDSEVVELRSPPPPSPPRHRKA